MAWRTAALIAVVLAISGAGGASLMATGGGPSIPIHPADRTAPGESSPSESKATRTISFDGNLGTRACAEATLVAPYIFCVQETEPENAVYTFDLEREVSSVDLTMTWEPRHDGMEELMLRFGDGSTIYWQASQSPLELELQDVTFEDPTMKVWWEPTAPSPVKVSYEQPFHVDATFTLASS